MEKRHRSTVDINVALLSQMKRVAADSDLTLTSAPIVTAIPEGQSAPPQAPMPDDWLGKTKRVFRPCAKILYRGMKPFVRPLVSRVRRYLLAKLQEDIAELQHDIRELKDTLHQEKDTLHQELERARVGIVRELWTERDRLHEGTQGILRELWKERDRLTPYFDRIERYALASARRVAVACGPDEVLVRTEVGYLLCSATDYAVLACLVDTGELERGTRLLLETLLKPGDVFVDIGAHLGLHTLAAARAMRGQGRIIAFEPFGPTARLLRRSVWLNGFANLVEVHQAAVSNRSGHQQLYLGMTSGHHSLNPLPLTSEMSEPAVEVPLTRLDDAVGADSRITLIKIDAEGAELEILEGARSLIEGNQQIMLIVEFGAAHLKRAGHSTRDWLLAFERFGLRYQAIDPDTGALEVWPIAQLEKAESVNLLFARPGVGAR